MLDQVAANGFAVGFSFGLFCLFLGWSLLAIVQFAKSVLNGVTP
jgi:hypothetical protein